MSISQMKNAPLGLGLALSLALTSAGAMAQPASAIDFGDNTSEWAFDGECDDSRFTGPGMTSTVLLDQDIGHDAADCRDAYEAGLLNYVGQSGPLPRFILDGIDFGDNASAWAFDDECDDSRFTGPGMTSTVLLDQDIGHDAADCLAAYESGTIRLR